MGNYKINTIFYFCPTQAQYDTERRLNNISPRTVVFVEDSKKIYRAGDCYSADASMTDEELLAALKRLIDSGAEGLDGLKGKDGESGSVVTVTPKHNTGKNIADITVDGRLYKLWAPYGSTGGSNAEPGTDGHEDVEEAIQQINDAIEDLSNTASQERDRLDNLIETLDDEISNTVADLFDDANWIHENWPDGSGSTSNFGQEDVEEYLQMIGFWTTDEYGNTITQWSKIQQDYQSIRSEVSALTAASSGDYTGLQSSLQQYVDTKLNTAVTNIGNTYVKTNDIKEILEWMYSGMRSSSSPNLSYAQLVAAGKNNTLGTNAISLIDARVSNIEGNYVAESAIESKVGDAITGLYNRATADSASTSIFSQVKKNSNDLAGLKTYIDANGATADLVTSLSGNNAGLALKSELNTAMASLVAQNEYSSAAVITKINSNNDSSVTIEADQININGLVPRLVASQAFINYLNAGNADFTGNVYAKKFVCGGGVYTGMMWDEVFDGMIIGTLEKGAGETVYNTNSTIPVANRRFAVSSVSGGIAGKSASMGAYSLTPYGLVMYKDNADMSINSNLTQGYALVGNYSDTPEYRCSSYDRRHIILRGYAAELNNNDAYFSVAKDGTNNGFQMILSNGTNRYIIDSTGPTSTSDITLKDVIEDQKLSAEQIASAPIFKFTFKGDSKINIGTSAQYWQNILPETVRLDENGHLGLSYDQVNIASVINLAKEVVDLKKENDELKARLAIIESKLGIQ